MDEGKWKEVKRVTREELGEELEELGRQLREGRFRFQGLEFSFVPRAAVEKRLYLRKGRLYLSCSFSIWAGEEGVEMGDEQEAPPVTEGGIELEAEAAPVDRKRLKKPMAALWKGVKRALAQKTVPSSEDVAELRRMAAQYGGAADPRWSQEWEECVRSMEAALAAAGEGRWQEAQAAAKEVDRITKACHKRFK